MTIPIPQGTEIVSPLSPSPFYKWNKTRGTTEFITYLSDAFMMLSIQKVLCKHTMNETENCWTLILYFSCRLKGKRINIVDFSIYELTQQFFFNLSFKLINTPLSLGIGKVFSQVEMNLRCSRMSPYLVPQNQAVVLTLFNWLCDPNTSS